MRSVRDTAAEVKGGAGGGVGQDEVTMDFSVRKNDALEAAHTVERLDDARWLNRV